MNTAKLSLELINNLDELENLSRNIEKFCELNNLSGRNLFELNLVIDEVFTNIISYAFRDKKEHRIKIDVEIIDQEILIRVEDDGVPFDPTAVPANDLNCPVEDRKIGGIGIHIINKIMNSVFYERIKDKNILTLKKYLNKK